MAYNQMRSQRGGGINMSANTISQSRYTYGANTSARSSVRMQASVALTGDGPFEEVENYIDQLDEMKDKAMEGM